MFYTKGLLLIVLSLISTVCLGNDEPSTVLECKFTKAQYLETAKYKAERFDKVSDDNFAYVVYPYENRPFLLQFFHPSLNQQYLENSRNPGVLKVVATTLPNAASKGNFFSYSLSLGEIGSIVDRQSDSYVNLKDREGLFSIGRTQIIMPDGDLLMLKLNNKWTGSYIFNLRLVEGIMASMSSFSCKQKYTSTDKLFEFLWQKAEKQNVTKY
ncbi:MAG: hypothetical protein WA981_12250 [Glaciecola sp.]